MVHINYKWNISKEKGKSLMIDTIQSILLEKKNQSIELNELLFLINHRTKHIIIKNKQKQKNLINFIKNNFKGIEAFIKNETSFIFKNNIISLENYNHFNDWIFI